ncbi:Transcription factor ILR3-like protein [Drosera capensis]
MSSETGHSIFDCDGFIEDFSIGGDAHFHDPNSLFDWGLQGLTGPSNVRLELDVTCVDTVAQKENVSNKRGRSEACGPSSSKARREKLRRDKLNDKFMELATILEPGRPSKMDKSAILLDAIKIVTQLRSEAQELKDSNSSLQEKIKELKVEKTELRDEKQRLKAEKERLELQLKTMNTQPGFLHPAPAFPPTFSSQVPPAAGKLVPFVGYPGVAMWQFMPSAAVDTSQDHTLRPPVA